MRRVVLERFHKTALKGDLRVKEEEPMKIPMTSLLAKTPLPTKVTTFRDMAPINVEKDLCRVPELSGIPTSPSHISVHCSNSVLYNTQSGKKTL